MATILAHITIREGSEKRFEQIARDLYSGTHANETGVRQYQYWRGAEPRTYYSLLSFDDFQAFIAHQTSDHHESVAPELFEVMETFKLEWVDPVQGASDLVPTEHQPAPAGASELTATYTDQFAADVADWWQDLR